MPFLDQINALTAGQPECNVNPGREELIKLAVERREAFLAANGALATWTLLDSTGRSPADTYIVRRPESEDKIDWGPINHPLDPEIFEMLKQDALKMLGESDAVFETNRYLSADGAYSLHVRTVTDSVLTALFTMNMFRENPEGREKSVFAGKPFTIVVLPNRKLDAKKYLGKLRDVPTDMAIAMDFDKRQVIIIGNAYMGSVKKSLFTVMNYILPNEGILPLHCSANEGKQGDIAVFLGLSGTGKTTISSDPNRALLGDDEFGWGANGVFNFENGCYAKCINLDPVKEAQIFKAIRHGAIVENAMMYPDGRFDFFDNRLTENSRASYLLEAIGNVKISAVGGHPEKIIFLTADASGVLPPVARLTREQAMLQFMMGYTSKLAGTETGITEPQSTFSAFFGAPFMPLKPDVYAGLLGEYTNRYGTQVYLVNTGWSGGPYGTGERMDLNLTRRIVTAVLEGELDDVQYRENKRFHFQVPLTCPDVDAKMLDPKSTWPDPSKYEPHADKLAADFRKTFEKKYLGRVSDAIAAQCPGR